MHGRLDADGKFLLFGGALTARLSPVDGRYLFDDLGIQMHWGEGDRALAPSWRLPVDRMWQAGEPPPVLVSEVDSPWARQARASLPPDPRDQFNELFARYAWSMDHADFTLMRSCLTDDVEGQFTPLGYLSGVHAVIGTLKAFRQSWPWMQHFGELLEFELDPDGRAASLTIGRIIPQQAKAPDGRTVYGAHYRLGVVRTDGTWRIRNFAYNPGWIARG